MITTPTVNGKAKPDSQESILTMPRTPIQEKQKPLEKGKANGVVNGMTTSHNESQKETATAHNEPRNETRSETGATQSK